LKPDRLIGDTKYGTGPLLAQPVQDKQIVHEASRDAARELINTDVYRQSRKEG